VAEDVLALLTEAGALKEGHFLLSSGRHSNRYIEKFDLLRNPRATERVCRGFVERYSGENVDVVVGPTTGGILLAFEVARQMGVASAYAERRSDGASGREIRRGTTFAPGQRVLIVDDILTSGGSVRETLAALEPHPVTVVGIGVLADRSGGKVGFGDVHLHALTTLDVETWTADACPFCADGIPLVKPGTTAIPAG
jgi:orotate phosphoribosyltransferase